MKKKTARIHFREWQALLQLTYLRSDVTWTFFVVQLVTDVPLQILFLRCNNNRGYQCERKSHFTLQTGLVNSSTCTLPTLKHGNVLKMFSKSKIQYLKTRDRNRTFESFLGKIISYSITNVLIQWMPLFTEMF